MTTFQYILDGILSTLAQLLPISEGTLSELEKPLLGWPGTSPEVMLLVTLVGSICFLAFFRYDWLGLFSALMKSIIRPGTLRSATRTLDQHTVIFLAMVTIPSLIVRRYFTPMIRENDFLMHPGFFALGSLLLFGFLQFSSTWNKRLKGLNHLKLSDAGFIAGVALFSVHPSFPLAGLLWIAFALTNYHYEAVFKLSMLVVGMHIFVHFLSLLQESTIRNALQTVGYLNSIALLVVTFTTFWILLENLQRVLSEHTYRSFKWVNLICAILFGAIAFGLVR